MKLSLLVISALMLVVLPYCEAQSGVITQGCGVLPKCDPLKNQVAACCEPCYPVYCFYVNRNCGKNCIKGCYCALGYVQMAPNGPCVPKQNCTKG